MVTLMSIDLHELGARRIAGLRGALPGGRQTAAAALRLGKKALAYWRWPAAAGAAFLAAGAPLFGGMFPLGLCLAASVGAPYALCAAAGAAAGYALALPTVQGAAYLAAVSAVALLRLLAGARRWQDTPLAPAAAGALCFCLVRAGLQMAAGAGLQGILSAASEALLILGMSYLLTSCFSCPARSFEQADSEQRAAQVFALMAALAVLAPFEPAGLSLAQIAAGTAVLAAAYRRGVSGACVAGAASLTALCAADAAAAPAGVALVAGALAAGLFFGESRLLTAGVFCGAGFLGVLCAGDAGPGLVLAGQLVLSGALFCLAPVKWVELLPAETAASLPAAEGGLGPQLRALSRALAGVGETVKAVCAAFARQGAAEPPLSDAVADRCCRKCRQRNVCWVEHGYDVYDAFGKLAGTLEEGGWAQAETLPDALKRLCIQPVTLAGAVNSIASSRAQRRGAYDREVQTRTALCEQYGALAAALADLARQAEKTVRVDQHRARRIRQMLREVGLEPLDTSASLDARGRLSLWATLAPITFTDEELEGLTAEAGALCHRRLGRCQVSGEGVTCLSWREAPQYAVRFGVYGVPAGGDVSADAARTDESQAGCACAVLCDGMGTGKAAAVDGAMAAQLSTELLRAGFGPEETARLVNVALALKGGEESATTLDMLRVDPYTGEAELYKAGAAPSFLLHGGAADAYLADSVPVGILGGVIGRKTSLELQPGDTAVLVTDGALSLGLQALTDLLAAHSADEPEDLARAVALAAREAAERPDDITVLAVRLEEAR